MYLVIRGIEIGIGRGYEIYPLTSIIFRVVYMVLLGNRGMYFRPKGIREAYRFFKGLCQKKSRMKPMGLASCNLRGTDSLIFFFFYYSSLNAFNVY